MYLEQFLRDDYVLLRLGTRDVEGIVGELSAKAGEIGVGPAALIGEKLLERERDHPTVMGGGLAIPHATVPGLARPVVGLALAGESPVPFGGPDLDPVRVFFVLLSPPGHEREHVKLLARICRLFRHEGFVDRLEGAEEPEQVAEIVRMVDSQHPA